MKSHRTFLVGVLLALTCRATEVEVPPPLGELHEVGGRKMHLYQTGEQPKGPAVVLEAGAGAFSMDWYLVQQEVAKFAKVCSYDRAGHAWSELGPHPRTMKQAVHDLRPGLAGSTDSRRENAGSRRREIRFNQRIVDLVGTNYRLREHGKG